jgi:hypothetical protein
MLCILFATLGFLALQGRSLVIFIKVCFVLFQTVSTLTIRMRGIKYTIEGFQASGEKSTKLVLALSVLFKRPCIDVSNWEKGKAR